jgi:hypothetical protein
MRATTPAGLVPNRRNLSAADPFRKQAAIQTSRHLSDPGERESRDHPLAGRPAKAAT